MTWFSLSPYASLYSCHPLVSLTNHLSFSSSLLLDDSFWVPPYLPLSLYLSFSTLPFIPFRHFTFIFLFCLLHLSFSPFLSPSYTPESHFFSPFSLFSYPFSTFVFYTLFPHTSPSIPHSFYAMSCCHFFFFFTFLFCSLWPVFFPCTSFIKFKLLREESFKQSERFVIHLQNCIQCTFFMTSIHFIYAQLFNLWPLIYQDSAVKLISVTC